MKISNQSIWENVVTNGRIEGKVKNRILKINEILEYTIKSILKMFE